MRETIEEVDREVELSHKKITVLSDIASLLFQKNYRGMGSKNLSHKFASQNVGSSKMSKRREQIKRNFRKNFNTFEFLNAT